MSEGLCKKYKVSITSLSKAVKLKPKSDSAWLGKAKSEKKLKKYEEAINSYSKALQSNETKAQK